MKTKIPERTHLKVRVSNSQGETMKRKTIVDRVEELLDKIPDQEFSGNLIICSPQGLRIRRHH